MNKPYAYGGARVQISFDELRHKLATNSRRVELLDQLKELIDFTQSEIIPLKSLWVYGSVLDIDTCDNPSDIDVCAFCLKDDYDIVNLDSQKRTLLAGLEAQMHRSLFGYEIDFMLIREPVGLSEFLHDVIPEQVSQVAALETLDRVLYGDVPSELLPLQQKFETTLSNANDDIQIYFHNRHFKDKRARAVVSALDNVGNYTSAQAERDARAARHILSLSKTYYEIILS